MKMTKTFLLSMLLACTGCTEEINTKEVYVKGDSGKFPDYGEVLVFPGAEGLARILYNSIFHLQVYFYKH